MLGITVFQTLKCKSNFAIASQCYISTGEEGQIEFKYGEGELLSAEITCTSPHLDIIKFFSYSILSKTKFLNKGN